MRSIAILSSLFSLLVVGCGSSTHAVDTGRARVALEHTLGRWQAGVKPADLRDESPSIVVQDPDWAAGRRLVSYTLDGEGEAFDANLHCNVELVLRGKSGKDETKTVTYLVGTDPVTTVFRKVSM